MSLIKNQWHSVIGQWLNTLTARVLCWVLVVVSATWLLVALLSYRDAVHEVRELFDAQLANVAHILLFQPAVANPNFYAQLPPVKYGETFAVQWLDAQGRVLAHSRYAPSYPMRPKGYGFASVGKRPWQRWLQFFWFTSRRQGVWEDYAWRVYAVQDPVSRRQVQVAERFDARDELALEMAGRLLQPMLVLLPLLGLGIVLAVRWGLRPLRQWSHEVQRCDPQHLQPLVLADCPADLQPLLVAMNGLLTRLAASLAQEKRFTADAAHELRTPLAAIRLHAQVALQAGGDLTGQTLALHQVIQGVDRMTRLVTQLLALARWEQTQFFQPTVLDCARLCQEVLADLVQLALDKDLQLSLVAPHAVWVAADATALGMALRNVLDNALRYTPEGGHVEVQVMNVQGVAHVVVCDSGGGIPSADLGRVCDRFYRVMGQEASGCGLGLALVQEIMARHHGQLHLENRLQGGLQVSLTLPVVVAPVLY